MAVSGTSLTQRIQLVGGDEIRNQLAQMGKAGEDAIKSIDRAVNAANSTSGVFAQRVAAIRGGIENVGRSLEPIKQGFENFGHQLEHSRDVLGEIADRAIPHFREIMAVAIGASVGGFVEFIKKSAEAADEVGKQSQRLGVSVESYQQLARAAQASGVQIDTFTRAFTQLAAHVDDAAKKQLDTFADIGKSLYGQVQVGLPTVIRGMGEAAQAASAVGVDVVRGTDKSVSAVVQLGAKAKNEVQGVADLLQGVFKQAGQNINLDDIVRKVTQAAAAAGDAGVKMRAQLRELGAVDLPVATIGEALDKMKQTFEQKIGSFVPLWEKTTEGIRRRPLDKIFLEFADKIQAMKNPTDQVTAAINVFGARVGARLIPMLREGSHGIEEIGVAFTKTGLAFTLWDTEVGRKFVDEMNTMSTSAKNAAYLIGNAFAPVLTPLVEAITKVIQDNAQAIRDFGNALAQGAKPVIEDMIALVESLGKESEHEVVLQTDAGKAIRGVWRAVVETVTIVVTVFKTLAAILDTILAPINAVLGTHFRGDVVIAVAVLGEFIGVWKGLGVAIALADAAMSAFITRPLAVLIATLGPAVLIPVVAAVLASFVDWNKALEGLGATLDGLGNLIHTLGEYIGGPFGTVLKVQADLLRGDFHAAWNDFIGDIQNALTWMGKLIDRTLEFLGLKAKMQQPGATTGTTESPTGGPAGTSDIAGDLTGAAVFATGGLVRGPGTGTSDSILTRFGKGLARISNGEFIVNSFSTRMFLPVLRAINSFRGFRPSAPRGMPAFAEGGLAGVAGSIAAAIRPGGGAQFAVILDGKSYHVNAPNDTANSFYRHAREKGMVSAGRPPGWQS